MSGRHPQFVDQLAGGVAEKLALYVHWPFCLSKCPYCDFNSHVRDRIDHSTWRDGLLRALDHMALMVPDRRVESIFFGGGTPSLMAPETVAAIIDESQQRWEISNDVEITLEANPTSVEAGRFAELRSAGVNRLSLGVQALDDDALKMLGRGHNAAQAIAALDIAAQNFDRFSFDLIYGRPGQNNLEWVDELTRALELAGGHLSLYQLTLEPGTAFFAAAQRGKLALPDEDVLLDMFRTTRAMCAEAGLPAYEISNFAAPGQESRHNLAYWRSGEYGGIGPGAHSRLRIDGAMVALSQHRRPENWIAAIEDTSSAAPEFAERELLDDDLRASEMIMMGLRLTTGLDLRAFQRALANPLEHFVSARRLGELEMEGFLRRTETPAGHYLTATEKGIEVLDAVLGELLSTGPDSEA